MKWAASQVNLASTLYFSAVLQNNDAPAREGRAAATLAAEMFAAQNEPRRAKATTALLAAFDDLINRLPP